MSEGNKTIARRYFEEAVNKGMLSVVGEIVATDHITHGGVASARGPENVKRRITTMRTAFPDVNYTIDDLIAEGDKVVIRYTARGTHRGAFLGTAPTGKRLTWAGIGIVRVVNGKMVEEWISWDRFGIMQQLGAGSTHGQSG